MQKIIGITLITACIFAVTAASAQAAVPKHTVGKAINLIKKTGNAISNTIWSNKGSIAIGTAAVAVATKPEILIPAVQGTGEVTGSTGRFIFYAVVAVLTLLGVRAILKFLNGWRILPLLVIGIMVLGCGATMAGTIPITEIQRIVAVPQPPWWNAIGWIILIIITIFG